MNENEQTRNTFDMVSRADATLKYTKLYLHPQNDDRIFYFLQATVVSVIIFQDRNEPAERLLNILNNRLDHPLSEQEQIDSLKILKDGIREGLL